MTINKMKEGQYCRIKNLAGDTRFISRITSVGLTLGAEVEVIQNRGKYPMLVYTRDSMIAINQKEAANISVEVMA